MAQVVLLLLGVYLLGSVPTAYIAGRAVKGIDLRQYGSGNLGGSNASLLMGKWALVGVGLAEGIKGALAVLVARWLGMGLEIQALAGLVAVVGNVWSLYLRFTGGRGVAATLGILLGLGWLELLTVFAGLALLGYLLRNTALWVGISAILLPVVSLALGKPTVVLLFAIGLLFLLAAKRLVANGEAFPPGLSGRRVLLNRLVYDRDVGPQGDWIYRTPSADDSPG